MAVSPFHVSLNSLSHVFPDGGLSVLRGIDFRVPRGQFLSIIGPSGSGKSTFLRIVGGLLRPSEGEAVVDGASPVEAQKRRDIGFVFQDPALLPWRNVLSNVRLPLDIDGLRGKRDLTDTGTLLDLIGLRDFAKYYPHQLSGGMQQRVAIARALAFDPSLLLMDEPFGALDEITRAGMRYELLRIWSNRSPATERKTVLFITHSIAEAISLSDRVIVLSPRPGRVIADIDIELPRPRTEDSERTQVFLDYADHLRGLLRTAA
jgi:NitT/TauT family transport system ATP-binding protein